MIVKLLIPLSRAVAIGASAKAQSGLSDLGLEITDSNKALPRAGLLNTPRHLPDIIVALTNLRKAASHAAFTAKTVAAMKSVD